MNAELPFSGFNDFFAKPLAETDARSFALIRRFYIEQPLPLVQPISALLNKLTGRKILDSEALVCWQQILKHKIHLQQRLGRTVGIQTAAIDYFDYQSPTEPHFKHAGPQVPKQPSQSTTTAVPLKNSTDYNLEKLKEELLRSKRYKHALSTILLDIDYFHEVNERLGFEQGDHILGTIVLIIRKIIRNVDFLSRLSGDRFLIILPNTNQREAQELAERIRSQIAARTSRLKALPEGVTATLSVGQCLDNDSSITYIRRLEHQLDNGKLMKRNTVHTGA